MEGGAYSGLLSSGRGADVAEATAAATRLVAGVTVWRARLDYQLDQLYDGKAGVLQPPVRAVLRCGLYELQHGGVAPHAVCSQWTEACRAAGKSRAAGLVNALLRRAVRGPLPAPPPPPAAAQPADPAAAAALGLCHSLPAWIAGRWWARLGRADAEALMAASNRGAPAFGLRPRAAGAEPLAALAAECARLGVPSAPSALLPHHMLRLEGVSLAPLLPMLRAGDAALQDEAAALVVRLLDPGPKERLADLCAAPGGKALFAAALGARVTALDSSAARLEMLRAAAAAYAADVECLHQDLTLFRPPAPFSLVLLDAPCSGLGVLAKRADLRWRRSAGDVADSAARAQPLLAAAARLVAPGGALVYSTCSTEPEENEEVVRAFLRSAEGAGWALERADEQVLRDGSRLPPAALSPCGAFLAPLPHVLGTDGAFGARLRRAAD